MVYTLHIVNYNDKLTWDNQKQPITNNKRQFKQVNNNGN